ncbi:MAG: hypothetical protein ABI442_22810 [Gemmatimonadaceae bacterium]
MANSTTIQSTIAPPVPIVILGTDALLAAAPATPVQLAHACLRGGFANVIPASWGDELVASAVMRALPDFGGAPAIQCSCPLVAHRLLSVGPDLRPALVPLVPPPVAIARYLRSIAGPSTVRITYVGACAGAIDSSIDIRMTPTALIELLAERDIMLDEQPRVFDSVLPYDRRRFQSQPGGAPSADSLRREGGSRTLVEVDGPDLVGEIAQHLLGGRSVLIDVAPALGCVCSGAVDGVAGQGARSHVVALEPPRSPTPIIDELPSLDLGLSVPAAARSAVDVMAAPRRDPVVSVATPARSVDGKPLPRAYVARRRLTPRGGTPVARGESPIQPLPPAELH